MQRALVMPRSALAVLAVFVLGTVGLADPSLVLAFAPALVLLGLLARGVHPGERLIERLRRRVAPARRVRAAASTFPRLPLTVRPIGLVLASALGIRPPPCGFSNH
jgi:hypothetical protein